MSEIIFVGDLTINNRVIKKNFEFKIDHQWVYKQCNITKEDLLNATDTQSIRHMSDCIRDVYVNKIPKLSSGDIITVDKDYVFQLDLEKLRHDIDIIKHSRFVYNTARDLDIADRLLNNNMNEVCLFEISRSYDYFDDVFKPYIISCVKSDLKLIIQHKYKYSMEPRVVSTTNYIPVTRRVF